jgi:GrpB-like predicted nucleotidyltransferase (UPF0157 family)
LKDDIVLVDYDPQWPIRFSAARAELLTILPEPPLGIEHIGSTAVPGFPAKPVIDVIVLVASMKAIVAHLPALEAIGYEYRPAVSSPERIFLRRHGSDGVRTHHLHFHTDAEDVRRHILFRDLLRTDPSLRQSYLDLKRDLAFRHGQDRQAYAKGKDAFVDAAVLSAGGPARRPFWNA